MRKCTVLLFTFFYFCNLFAQKQLFYLNQNKKEVNFETIDTLSYILFKTGVTDVQKRTAFKNSRKAIPLDGRSMFLNINSEDDIAQLKNNNNIESVYSVIRSSQSGDMQVLTDDILVKVNSGESIESVFSQLNIPYISESQIEGLENVSLVRVPSSDNSLNIVNKLVSSNLVIYAEPDFIRFTDVPTVNTTVDNYSPQQWAIKNTSTGFDVNALLAWRISKGKDIKVAVIDEGVDLNHPDLKANLLSGYDGTDWGALGQNGAAAPGDYHGTACAGIIAAVENNIGMTGVAPQCKVIPVRIATVVIIGGKRRWKSTVSSIARGITQAYLRGADVLSCSFGKSPFETVNATIKDAIISATTQGRNGRGSIIVFATANDSLGNVSPYCLLDNVISVGAINSTGSRTAFSNYGNGLKVVAPGSSIYTTDISGASGSSSGDYFYFSGTSAACPYVAGIAGLLLSVKPNAQASSITSWIYTSCTKLPIYQYSGSGSNGTWNNETGYGLVDAYEAIIASKPFSMVVPELLCECETHTFSISGPTDRCDSVVWNLHFDKEIISGSGTTSVEMRILEAPGYAVPFVASIYYGDRVVRLEGQTHAGVPETYDIIGGDEATEMELMYAEVIMESATSYTWELKQGRCGIWPNNNKADLMPYDTNRVIIIVTGYNRCGSYAEWLNFTPNRRISKQNLRQAGMKSVTIYNLSYELVYSNKNLITPFDINAVNLPSGFYVIENQLENGIITREKVYVP